jgi:photosynthetic reaction center cytochrome c subunit
MKRPIPLSADGVRVLLAVIVGASLLLAGCERLPVDTEQVGFRGVQMGNVYNPRTVAALKAANQVPEPQPPTEGDAPLAKDVYQNVQVLTDLNIAEFTRIMLAMTEWVSPEQGCTYCHAGENLADDTLYTKVVSRRMLEMTRKINMDWQAHVAQTGVTCYTCHRGQNVPAKVWFIDPGPYRTQGLTADSAGQNIASSAAGSSSLPYEAFLPFLRDAQPIRTATSTALPSGNKRNIKETERTYSLMMHMSQGLGVNCTFCHNSRSFSSWEESTPQRVTAWHGIRMARELNTDYLEPLTATFPAKRLGPTGDVAKINCSTCHQGVSKPLYGVSMATDYPELTRIKPPVEAPSDMPAAEPANEMAVSDTPAPPRVARAASGATPLGR